jgi:hypothetical protein
LLCWIVKGTYVGGISSLGQMWVNTKSSSICLGKSPQDVFSSLVDIGSTYLISDCI